jgi:hypothetical protein
LEHDTIFIKNDPYLILMKYCFVFVCQQGDLEIKSMLLAASLKRYLRGEYELVAALPQPETHWETLSEKTQILMQTLGVRTVPIVNRIDQDYPIGNKIDCLNISTCAEQIVFLDSDILCLREGFPAIGNAPFNAKPADLATFTRDVRLWQKIYDLFELALPQRRVLSSISGEMMLPYFNAGLIIVQNGLNFGQVWERCCQVIDAEPSITKKRPWLDQIALPIAVKQLDLNYHCLDERFNYPAHLKPLPPLSHLPFFCHYHWPSVIRREPYLNQLVIELVNTYPLLKECLLDNSEWAQLLKPYTLQRSTARRFSWPVKRQNLPKVRALTEAIITGIPRSGTSYLCRLLHSVPDCVVVNEPTEIFAPLNNQLTFWQVATFYQALRRDILDGLAINNKLHEGKVIEDTAQIDMMTAYHPTVSRPDFLLATKNTLAYMARLPQLKQVLPHAPIIACIRHPLDTIASWKTSFPHLKQAKVTEFPIGSVNDPLLSGGQREQLAEIAATPNEALKRALLWRYLAELILTHAHQLLIVRYEELVTEPVKVLNTILKTIPNAPTLRGKHGIRASSVRQKREVLDEADLQAVNDICRESAIALGLLIND